MKAFPLAMCISVAFFLLIINAIRRRAIRDEMTVLWVSVALAILVLSLTLPAHVLDHVAHALGIAYGSDLVFVAAVVFLVILVFQLSITVGRLWLRTTRLAQDIAMLRYDLGRATGNSNPGERRPVGNTDPSDSVVALDDKSGHENGVGQRQAIPR